MGERVNKGVWVEIHSILLAAGERAGTLPEDTQRLPLEMRVKGFLTAEAGLGDEVEIETVTGRRLRGRLAVVNPAYSHSFGAPLSQLSAIGGEVRALLRKAGA
ncbi:MAG: 2-amino-4-oxopentanoate thiolase subunit OrtA [Candidatus Sedimenticola sp. (ex Thyasira tokunagai)]